MTVALLATSSLSVPASLTSALSDSADEASFDVLTLRLPAADSGTRVLRNHRAAPRRGRLADVRPRAAPSSPPVACIPCDSGPVPVPRRRSHMMAESPSEGTLPCM
ncbi:hypothetical protein GCM10027061_23520 [Nesterenkonia suensis]